MQSLEAASGVDHRNDSVGVGAPAIQSQRQTGIVNVATDTALCWSATDCYGTRHTDSLARTEKEKAALKAPLSERDIVDGRSELSLRILDTLKRDNYWQHAQRSAARHTALLDLDNPFVGLAIRGRTSLVKTLTLRIRRISAVFL